MATTCTRSFTEKAIGSMPGQTSVSYGTRNPSILVATKLTLPPITA